MAVKVPKGLGPDVEQRIGELVREAEQRQAEELRRALDHTLRLVPRPLRGLVRKIVGA
jgi:hypothetical protein